MKTWSDLRLEHRMILEAIDAIIAVTEEPPTAKEVHEVLLEEALERLDQTYSRTPLRSIERILRFLTKAGHLADEYSDGDQRYRLKLELPKRPPSNRQVTMRLVEDCFETGGHAALRSGDIKDFFSTADYAEHLTWEEVRGALASLLKTGDVQDLGSAPGGGESGHRIFAPLGVEVKEGPSSTWLGHVLKMFWRIWHERIAEAESGERRPRPPGTGDVRAAVKESGEYAEKLDNSQLLVNAVRNLSEREEPPIRKVRRPGKRNLLWAPVDVPDEDLDLGGAFSADTERIVEAAARAVERFARPVRVEEVQDEIERDPALRPNGQSEIYEILHDLAKTTVCANGRRVDRVRQRVRSVGTVRGRTYYTTEDSQAGERFIKARNLKSQWDALQVSTELNAISDCPQQPLQIGRALELHGRLEGLRDRLLSLASAITPTEPAAGIVERFEQDMELMLDQLKPFSRGTHDSVPLEVDSTPEGLTAGELVDQFAPFYPPIQRIEEPHEIVSFLDGAIWRIPNRNHTYRFDKAPGRAAEYLFEKTDSLIYMVNRWGGAEALYQARMAQFALGRLRDSRFVLPLLESANEEDRFVGVACLAFLQEAKSTSRLQEMMESDPEEGVRASSAWALGFLDPAKRDEARRQFPDDFGEPDLPWIKL